MSFLRKTSGSTKPPFHSILFRGFGLFRFACCSPMRIELRQKILARLFHDELFKRMPFIPALYQLSRLALAAQAGLPTGGAHPDISPVHR